MEREVYTYNTPVTNTAVVIKKDMTGREKRTINRKMLGGVELANSEDGKVDFGKMSLDRFEEYRDEMVRQLVVSVADKTDNVLDAVLDLPTKDTDAVIEEVSRVFSNKEFEEKKTE